jgi:hypothetical protein
LRYNPALFEVAPAPLVEDDVDIAVELDLDDEDVAEDIVEFDECVVVEFVTEAAVVEFDDECDVVEFDAEDAVVEFDERVVVAFVTEDIVVETVVEAVVALVELLELVKNDIA